MSEKKDLVSAVGEFLVFVADDGTVHVHVHVHVQIADGTVGLTQKELATLYGKDLRTIDGHLGNIYEEGESNEEGELDPVATIRSFRLVQNGRNRTGSASSHAMKGAGDGQG